MKVVDAEEPCASKITDLVGTPNPVNLHHWCNTILTVLTQKVTPAWRGCMNLWQLLSNGSADFKQILSAQVIPWLSCYAIATVVSLAALFIKAKMFRDQIRRRRKEFILDEEEQADRIVKLKKHTKRSA